MRVSFPKFFHIPIPVCQCRKLTYVHDSIILMYICIYIVLIINKDLVISKKFSKWISVSKCSFGRSCSLFLIYSLQKSFFLSLIAFSSLLLFQTVLLLKKVSRAQCLSTSFNDTTYKIVRWLRGSKEYILLGRVGMRFQFSYLTFTLYSF